MPTSRRLDAVGGQRVLEGAAPRFQGPAVDLLRGPLVQQLQRGQPPLALGRGGAEIDGELLAGGVDRRGRREVDLDLGHGRLGRFRDGLRLGLGPGALGLLLGGISGGIGIGVGLGQVAQAHHPAGRGLGPVGRHAHRGAHRRAGQDQHRQRGERGEDDARAPLGQQRHQRRAHPDAQQAARVLPRRGGVLHMQQTGHREQQKAEPDGTRGRARGGRGPGRARRRRRPGRRAPAGGPSRTGRRPRRGWRCRRGR